MKQIKNDCQWNESGWKEQYERKIEEISFFNLQEAGKVSILEEKIEEMKFILAQETEEVMILEKKVENLKIIIFILSFLFIIVIVRIIKWMYFLTFV